MGGPVHGCCIGSGVTGGVDVSSGGCSVWITARLRLTLNDTQAQWLQVISQTPLGTVSPLG